MQTNGLPSAGIWPEATTPADLDTALTDIRADELAITLSPTHIIGLAVPIRKGGLVVASLSIFLPEIRCSVQRRREIVQRLRQSA